MQSVAIPPSVTEIGDRAFAFCSALAAVAVPDSVTEIGFFAFYDCWALPPAEATALRARYGGGIFGQ